MERLAATSHHARRRSARSMDTNTAAPRTGTTTAPCSARHLLRPRSPATKVHDSNEPRCEDPYCCNIVRDDLVCCDLEWTQSRRPSRPSCAMNQQSGLPLQRGFSDHENPGCEIESCCYRLRPRRNDDGKPDYADCCEIEWDSTCVDIANTICRAGTDVGLAEAAETEGHPELQRPGLLRRGLPDRSLLLQQPLGWDLRPAGRGTLPLRLRRPHRGKLLRREDQPRMQ